MIRRKVILNRMVQGRFSDNSSSFESFAYSTSRNLDKPVFAHFFDEQINAGFLYSEDLELIRAICVKGIDALC